MGTFKWSKSAAKAARKMANAPRSGSFDPEWWATSVIDAAAAVQFADDAEQRAVREAIICAAHVLEGDCDLRGYSDTLRRALNNGIVVLRGEKGFV